VRERNSAVRQYSARRLFIGVTRIAKTSQYDFFESDCFFRESTV
jgi:hypothetical protein